MSFGGLQDPTEITSSSTRIQIDENTDLAGNPGTGDNLTGTVDLVPPTLTIAAADFNLADGEDTTVSFEFSEDVAGFTEDDVILTGGTLADFTQVDGNSWTATFTQDGADAPGIAVNDDTYTDLAGNPGTGDNLTGTVDLVPPTLSIAAADFNLADGEETAVSFEFSEDVAGFTEDDVILTGGTLADFTQVDGNSWTATFTQDGTDAPGIAVNDDTYTDLAGNPGTGDNLTGTVDLVPPTLSIAAADFNLAEGEETAVTFEFSEDVAGFTVADVILTGGTLADFTQVDGNSWAATFTQDGTDAPSIAVNDATYTDLAGNPGTGDNLTGTVDLVPPTLSIAAADFNLADGEETAVSFEFSEDVAGFTEDDVILTGGTLADFTQVDGNSWTATFTQDGTDAPGIAVNDDTYTDLAGNPGTGDNLTGTVDLVPPTLSIAAADFNLADGEETAVSFEFSEDVAGFTEDDVILTGGTLADFTQVDGNSWTATFTQAGTDAPGISVNDDTYTDLAGNPGTGDDLTGTVDLVPPTLTIAAADFNLAEGEETAVTFEFSEDVAGFTVADVILTGGTLADFTQVDGNSWAATFTQDGTDAPSIAVNDATYTDLAGNPGTGDDLTGTVDLVPPTLTIAAADFNLAEGEETAVTFEFSEDVAGFTEDDVILTGGTLADFTQVDGNSWTATFTQDGTDAPGIAVNDDTYTDLAGNPGTGDNLTGTVDLVPPTLSIAAADFNLADGEETAVTFEFSEDVAGFTEDDVILTGGTLADFTQVDGNSWTATFTQDGTDAPGIAVNDDTYTDLAGNPGTGDNLTGTVDLVPPTLSIAAADFNLADGEETAVSFEFSEDVAGFTEDDVILTGGTLADFTQVDGNSWTATFTQDGTDAPGIAVNDDTYTDLAGNPGTGDNLGGISVADQSTIVSDADIISIANGQIAVADSQGDPLTVVMSTPATVLFADGEPISWTGDGTQLLIGSTVSNGEIIRLSINNTGNYQVTLSQPLDHPEGNGVAALDFDVTVSASDAGATLSGNLTVSVEDDIPVAAGMAQFTINSVPTTVSSNAVDSYGADGGTISQVRMDGYTYSYDADADSITQSGSSELASGYTYVTDTNILSIENVKGETLSVNVLTGDYSFTATGIAGISPIANVAPEVGTSDPDSLLGLAAADVLGLIDLGNNQFFTATDINNNIETVVIEYSTLVGLGKYEFNASDNLAADLGLAVNIVNSSFLTAASSELTITALDGGTIDNAKLNELLGTVTFDSGLLTVGLLNSITISATDSNGLNTTVGAGTLLNASLLQSTPPSEIIEGTNGSETLTGDSTDNRLYAYGGDDILNGEDGSDILRGGNGNDELFGGTGNDILIGGSDDDTLTGGSGGDIFLWETNDQGLPAGPAADIITDFDISALSDGGDVIDLGDLLQGEGQIGSNPGNLSNYLHFETSGSDTILYISTTGEFLGGFTLADADQQILFQNVDLIGDALSDLEIIAGLLSSGKLIVDAANSDTVLLGGYTDASFVLTDNDGDTATTSARFDSTGLPAPAGDNSPPDVQVSGAFLDLIDLSTQDLNTLDVDDNLQQVIIRYMPLLSVGLTALTLNASTDLATELGLSVTIENDAGILGLVAPSSVLTITAADNGTIDNLAINELLATVQFNQNWLVDGIDVLNATTITGIDNLGASSSDTLATLLGGGALSLLNSNAAVQTGTGGSDILSGTGSPDRLYGFNGDDTISGNAGNDLLRGGAGADTLYGGEDNDTLEGGADADIFQYISINDGNDQILDFNFFGEGDTVDLDTLFDTLGINDPGTAANARAALITLDNSSSSGNTILTIEGVAGFSITMLGDLGTDTSNLGTIGILVGDES